MTDQILGSYRNGNYKVLIFSDGSKIRYNKESTLVPDRPESMDIKITNMCDMGCAYCHEDAKANGAHGDIMGAAFIRDLKPFTELAIGGGNPLSHPQLTEFLELCKEKDLIASITINQQHFLQDYNKIKSLADRKLIYGIGISLLNPTNELICQVKTLDNAVLHIIAGVNTQAQLKKLYDSDIKLLILGYKTFRRGATFYSKSVAKNLSDMRINIAEIIPHFKTVSFDNLAIKQLKIKDIIKDWDKFYMGDDGAFTMYIDMVKHEFAKSSVSEKRYAYQNEPIEEMFQVIRKE